MYIDKDTSVRTVQTVCHTSSNIEVYINTQMWVYKNAISNYHPSTYVHIVHLH